MRVSPCYFLFLHFMAFMDSVSVLYQNITDWDGVSRLHWCLPLNPLLLLLGLSSGANPRHGDRGSRRLPSSLTPSFSSIAAISTYADARVLALISVHADASMAFTAPCCVQLSFACKLRTALPSFTWSSLVLSWC